MMLSQLLSPKPSPPPRYQPLISSTGAAIGAGGVAIARVGKDNDFAARAYGGYQFNRYFAAEFGYTYLPSSVTVNRVGKIRNWALDLSGKVFAPVVDQFGVFGRVGVSYLRSTVSGTLALASPLAGGATRISNWNVTYGAGLYYDYNANWRLTGEWQRFHGDSSIFNRSYQPFMDAFTVGVSYKLPVNLLV